jgi:hypothetical protein
MITQWSRALLVKLIVAQLVKKNMSMTVNFENQIMDICVLFTFVL